MTYRMPNFTSEQKMFLLRRIHTVVDTVQDFRKDTNTTVHRNAVWAELAQSFNAAFPNRPPSSIGSLKTLWKRLKVECRMALQKRQEQLVTGLPVTTLTQVQRQVISLVPSLTSCLEEIDGDGSIASGRSGSPRAGKGFSGTNGMEHEDPEHSQNNLCNIQQEVDSKENLTIDLGLVLHTQPPDDSGIPPGPAFSPPHSNRLRSNPRSSHPNFYPSPARSSSGTASRTQVINSDTVNKDSAVSHGSAGGSSENSLTLTDPTKWEARRRELFELEHQQTMSLLLLQQCVWEEKKKAVRQKQKAARAKRRYYQVKLQKMGAEVSLSSSDSDDDDY